MDSIEQLGDLVRRLAEGKGGKLLYLHAEVGGEPEWGPDVTEAGLDPRLAEALRREGVRRFYRFQWDSYRLVMDGHDLVITAGTGTGKTEAFLVPTLDSILKAGSRGRLSLLVYPTKALARDQAKRLGALIEGSGIRYAILDGDTPPSERRAIYEDPPQLIITNPDMIHLGLALSKDFRELMSEARTVVFDELHVYQGVFGSHLRWIVERLRRVAGDLQLVGSGATIGNPEQLGRALFSSEDVKVVQGPLRRRGVALHALVDYGAQSRWTFAAYMAASLARSGLKVLTFVDSQQMAELVSRMISRTYGVDSKVHRAGLPAEYRRRVEEEFASGKLMSVVATPTLELGIDIGDLDAVIMASLPKSFSSYVQRSGRAGRRDRPGLVVTLLGDDPIEAYYARNPSEHFSRKPEPGYIEPNNVEVAKLHLTALLLQQGALKVSSLSEMLKEVLEQLASEGFVKVIGDIAMPNWRAAKEFVSSSSLRAAGPMVRIYFQGRHIGEREMPMALYDLYPGALYYHSGHPYMVTSLKVGELRADVVKLGEDVSFYTKPLYDITIASVRPLERRLSGPVPLVYGDVQVIVSVNGYVIKDAYSGVTVSERYFEAPITWEYWTKGVLLRYPLLEFENLEAGLSAYHALEHVLIAASRPIVGASDTDLGGVSYPTGHIVIYDAHVGGNGLSRLVFERLEEIESIAENIVASCTCEDGCPKCVFSPYCGNNNKFLSRHGALKVLKTKKSASPQPMSLEGLKESPLKAA